MTDLAGKLDAYPFEVTIDEKISFIICSIDREKFERIETRIDQCMEVPYEIIRIPDAKSLCEGYTEGLTKASGNILIFCHDDIDFLSDQNLWPRLSEHLKSFDVVGVAGSSKLAGPMWMTGGPATWAGIVIHRRANGPFDITIYDNHPELITPVQALDGVFLAMRREVAEQIGFDGKTFDGFHGYDIDFTYRCYKSGLRLGACKDLLLVHESGGNFSDKWRQYGQRFIEKFPEFSEKSLQFGIRYSPCSILARDQSEARRIGQALLDGYIDPDDVPLASEPKEDRKYNFWRKRKSLQEIDGQLFAERMIKWQNRPLFNIIVQASMGEENLLADTLDSIGAQWYPDWHLTIVAEFPASSPDLTEIPQVSWVECAPKEHAGAINEVLEHLPGDWLFFLDAGCSLEAHALLAFGDTINSAATPNLVYCDEDQCGSEPESFVNPRFKPDFNLELLRGMYYIGTGFALRRSTFNQIGGLSQNGTAGLMGLCLKTAEACAHTQLAHIPDVLVHLPTCGLPAINPDSEQNEVREHLNRLGIEARVSDGLVTGTQAIFYATQGTPLVSIIIPTKDQPGYISHCVESLLAETRYPNLELILVAHQTTDPDALAYFEDLRSRPTLANRLQIITNDAPFNYAALCNQGAAVAKGDYFLFLDNDTEFIQPDWLDQLVGHIQQKQVAAVSPRLSCPDGNLSVLNQMPRILGLNMLAGSMAPAGSNLVDPGYYGNLQVAQEVSALSGSCLFVRSNLFKEVGGFDAVNTPIHEPVLDLCLRLRQANYKLIWTPWVNVVHRNQSTRKRLASSPDTGKEIEASFPAERDYLSETYLPQLANDPYYHRHLSLQEPYGIEPYAVIDWDTRFHDRLRVLGTPLTSASGEYRMVAPFRAMQKAGVAQCCYVHPIGNRQQRVLNPIELARAAPDTLMVQQAIDDTQLYQMRRYRKFNKDIFMTYAVDDIIGNLPKKHYLYNFQIREGKSRLREALAQTDRLIASTEPIADFCRDMIDDIVVVPNRLEGDKWLHLKSARRVGKKPRVGWAGAQQHLGDLELIKDVVEATYKEVEWVFMGMCPDFLKPYINEEHAFVNISDYPAKLASLNLDLAIAPLEQVVFNEGKSNLRLLEYGIMGWPVVCTDVYPYQTNNAPVKRVQNSATAWTEAIRERINDLDATAKEGDALRQWVLKHYILEDHLDDWLSAITPR